MALRMIARVTAIVLLALIPIGWYAVVGPRIVAPIVVRPDSGGHAVVAVPSEKARAAGIRAGDRVDVTGLTLRERLLVTWGSRWQPVSYPIVHGTSRRAIVLSDIEVPFSFRAMVRLVAAFVSIVTLILGAIMLWRRPSVLTLAFAVYALGTIYIGQVLSLATVLPEGAFDVVYVLAEVLIASAAPFALMVFAMRFPGEPRSRVGRFTMHAVDTVFFLACIVYAVRSLRLPTIYDADWYLDAAPIFVATAFVAVVAAYRYARSLGNERRRLAWVLAGTIVTGVAYAVVSGDSGFLSLYTLPPWALLASNLAGLALPLALAYAVLRHRILDIGFVLNRTVVYTVVTASLVIAVSAVDWVIGRILSSGGLATVLEAAVTIAFGVTLNWFHARVERLVDRALFRERYRAAERIESRIRALDYASSPSTVDEALVDEPAEILRLGSAAVFRSAGTNRFERTASVAWNGEASQLEPDHLLIRTLRAEERTLFLDAAGVACRDFPSGTARPDVAIPIIVRHALRGVAVYGHREGEAAIDPEERVLLERLARAAGIAYEAIEADEWRRRALSSAPPVD